MAYIPPNLRKKSTGSVQPEAPPVAPQDPYDRNLTLDEIKNHFWPSNGDVEEESKPTHDSCKGKLLHDSSQAPGKLAYVVLYWGANPHWNSKNIIFTKSSLELLPKEFAEQPQDDAASGADQKTNRHTSGVNIEDRSNVSASNDVQDSQSKNAKPSAVFKQMSAKHQTRGYQFEGWYIVDDLQFLEPNSPELIRMLEQKRSRQDKHSNTYMPQRRGADWDKSLGYRRCVVKLKIDKNACRDKGEPQIERLPEPAPRSARKSSTANKSVNEMLAELRMKDAKPETAAGEESERGSLWRDMSCHLSLHLRTMAHRIPRRECPWETFSTKK